ncbi:quinoprotein relay system zinc metallohydrolase 1 [Skermanella sp. TT6]|uniref:Quinoprotein relay system zinc metallohydrolase 1 n=1 Tax=Skermanella cutis TaxID=2775420 RepID=A0ABX7AZS6_9PROT|nr:quinoprotein relay system zinc metallohydrolase 1 [Skermanella sp. TT6]QQP87501.1 quinoprotein relay system zinc metallohydrolase 1 [Skermanella sp. TT6]
MRGTLKGAVGLLCLILMPAGAVQAAGRTYGLEARRIAADTYVFEGQAEHFTAENGGNILNSGFIVTDDGVIVIQTGPSRRYGEEMRAAIGRVTPRPIAKVFVSNLHPDYFLGSQAFADVPVAALPGTIDGIRSEGPAVTENMYRLIGDWMRGTEVVVPTEPVLGATVVYGGHRLRLMPLDGHTAADLALFDETTGVLFAGGLVFSDRTPTTPHADIARWLRALDELEALDIAVLVPNHGTVRSDEAAIGQTRDYLTWLDATLRGAAETGLDMNEVMAIEIPARFAVLNVLREEFTRSVAHLYPKIEQSVLPRVN